MKYLSLLQINESLARLRTVNQFFGFTFLAAKKAGLPVGSTITISLDSITQSFLDKYYRVDPRSQWFFRVFGYNNRDQLWLKPDYPGKGLQKLNTSTFKDAFVHEKKSKDWGWRDDYVNFLEKNLSRGELVSAFHLAVWLFRSKPFNDDATREDLVLDFFEEFNITDQEKEKLFTEEIVTSIGEENVFQPSPVSWKEIISNLEPAPDVAPSQGGILSYLEFDGIGPVTPLIFEPANRLNIITGDNGLGKTFILETAWWALTGKWADRPAYPNNTAHNPKIKFLISGKDGGKVQTISYSRHENKWPTLQKRATISGLVVYARVDGSFALWDPAGKQSTQNTDIIVFNREEVWNGNKRIEGLIRDWTKWQDKPDKYPFEIFQNVIARMSPPEMGKLKTGQPVRVLDDAREIPTLVHSYGEVPILNESAGIKRIITLAYLIVWAWNEHRILSEQFNRKLEKRMVILIDELEAHLHPRWQRVILPAILDTAKILSSDLETQVIVATHSPLVLASSESIFADVSDKLFHLETNKKGDVSFLEMKYVKYGHVNAWLESDIFDLPQARSDIGEQAIAKAIALQTKEGRTKDEVREVTDLLLQVLPAEDKFWNRWVLFARKNGVEV